MGNNRPGVFSFGFMIVVIILLVISAFFTPGVESPTVSESWLSSVLSLSFLVCICISLYYINNSYFLTSNGSSFLPVIYLLLVFSFPEVVYFSFYHIAALLLIWGLYFNVKFLTVEDKKINYLFISVLLFSSMILIEPYFLWMMGIMFFINISPSKMNFFRYAAASIGAFLIPFIYYFSIRYLFFDLSLPQYFDSFLSSLVLTSVKFPSMKISVIFMVSMIAVVSLRSFFYIIAGRNELGSNSAKSFNRVLFLGFVTFILSFLYSSDVMSILVVFIPVSMVIFAFLKSTKKKTEAKIVMTLLLLSIIVGRISLFV